MCDGEGSTKLVATLSEAIEEMFDRTVCAMCQTHLKYLLLIENSSVHLAAVSPFFLKISKFIFSILKKFGRKYIARYIRQ
jgi:hypothetical protein